MVWSNKYWFDANRPDRTACFLNDFQGAHCKGSGSKSHCLSEGETRKQSEKDGAKHGGVLVGSSGARYSRRARMALAANRHRHVTKLYQRKSRSVVRARLPSPRTPRAALTYCAINDS